jgi:hypothetical protein
MTGQHFFHFAGGRIPDANGFITAAGHQPFAVTTEGGRVDLVNMAFQDSQQVALGQ